MKISVTGLRGIPGVMGGVETHCEELLPRIADTNPDMRIEVCCRAPYVDAAKTEYRGIALAPLYSPTGTASEAIVSTLLGVLHARRRGADAVHIHAVGPALLAPLARLLGLRVVVTHHGADYNRDKWGRFARLMLKTGEQAALRFAHRVICVSPSLAETMRQRYPAAADKVVFIPNGVSAMPEDARPGDEVLAELGLEAGRYVLCVARLVPEKGIHYLIEAFRRSGDTRTLAIAGAGREGDRYADELMASAGGSVRMLGRQPRSVLGVLYRHASQFVLPSFHEGLPIVALEALSCDCPVLLSDIQPNLDLGLPESHYFPVGDVAALAARLAKGGPSPGERAAGALPLMDWDEVAQRTATQYRALARRSPDGRTLSHAG